MPTILITGADGQLGSELAALLYESREWNVKLTDKNNLDITNHLAMEDFFAEIDDLKYIINCAAYTAVDRAEEDVEMAHSVNMNGAQNLARIAKSKSARMIQISTDYVYHSDQNVPFKEGDLTSPKSVYASTKLAGDNFVQRALPEAVVLRTSWVYSSFGHNFVKTMLRLGKERDSLSVVFDQIGTPTYARDLAEAILEIIRKIEKGKIEENNIPGIYHYSNEGVTSWYDFALAIFDIENINCNVSPIETREYPTPAKRPHFSVLNKAKIKNTFGLKIRHWRAALTDCLEELRG